MPVFAISIFFSAYIHADLFGKAIFWALFFLSFISWTILLHKIWITRKLRQLSLNFASRIEKKKENLLKEDPLINIFSSNPFYQIYSSLKQKSLQLLTKNQILSADKKVFLSTADMELIEAGVDVIMAHETKKMSKNLFVLSTIVTLAPFIGLLGTIWGILLTFSNMQNHALVGNSSVLSGLALALATTVLGLLVAIPALISYNYLKSSIKEYVTDMENFSSELLATVEIQYRNPDGK